MPLYRISADVQYYFTVEADNEEEAIEKAQECDYETDQCYYSVHMEAEELSENAPEDRKVPLLEPITWDFGRVW